MNRIVKSSAMTAVAVVALAGCNSSSKTEVKAQPTPTATTDSSSTPSQTPAAEPTESASAVTGAAAKFTAQGTKLKVGEKAVVPYVSQKHPGALGVSVVSIKAGTPSQLAPLKLGDRAKGFTPYYVNFKVTNESGTDFSYTSLGLTHGLLADGTQAQGVLTIGDFAPCNSGDAGSNFNKVGASYTTCTLALAPSGAKVTGADYSNYDSSVNKSSKTDYAEDPITWQ